MRTSVAHAHEFNTCMSGHEYPILLASHTHESEESPSARSRFFPIMMVDITTDGAGSWAIGPSVGIQVSRSTWHGHQPRALGDFSSLSTYSGLSYAWYTQCTKGCRGASPSIRHCAQGVARKPRERLDVHMYAHGSCTMHLCRRASGPSRPPCTRQSQAEPEPEPEVVQY